jgi:hypothetical protein
VKFLFLILSLMVFSLEVMAAPKPDNKLEQAVKAGPKAHKAKPEHPHDYANPGRGHKPPKPPKKHG